MDYAAKATDGLCYEEFLAKYGSSDQQSRWANVLKKVQLTAAQRATLTGFKRTMHVFCLAGAWCGDCVDQCPILHAFSQATDTIQLRFFDRDAHPDLQKEWNICGGARVPSVVFLSEDFQPTGRYGDRTLAKYRVLAARLEGASCPTGIGPVDANLLADVTAEWLEQFERNQLILRTSPRLRQKHGD